MYGGAYDASRLSLEQGKQFQEVHINQHGGGSWTGAGAGAALDYDSMLPQELVASARVGPTLQSFQQIAGMRDAGPGSMEAAPGSPAPQAGGARKNRKGSRRA